TLERWRWTGEGPKFIKLGGRVIYRFEDVEAFEAERIRGADGEPHRPMSA
ncbi:MAG TPA: DNA-binding protein, partial [Rhodobacteraceae bacterium]|nr:DNA-binding protein [Paracoccaceae bacterium]